MFCKKCGNQMDNDAKFCAHCGEPNVSDNAQPSNSGEPHQQVSTEPSTGQIFMKQVGALSKTGMKGLKEATAQAQIKAKELSASVEKSQSLKQLGVNKNLFLFVCGTLVLNFIFTFSHAIYADIMFFGKNNYSFIGFCSYMSKTIGEIARNFRIDDSDAVLYKVLMYLGIAGVILIVLSVIKMVLPLIQDNENKTLSLRFVKITAIYNLVLTLLVLLIIQAAYSSQVGIDIHMTGLGWVYIIESIVLIISVFLLSSRLRKINAEPNTQSKINDVQQP